MKKEVFINKMRFSKKSIFKAALLFSMVSALIFGFMACGGTGDPMNSGGLDPSAGDYNFTGDRTQTAGEVTGIQIVPNDGCSSGKVTVWYEGISGTNYSKSKNIPQVAGNYKVTFDVAAASGWNAVKNLDGGELIVNPGYNPDYNDPKVDDYDISGSFNQSEDAVTEITVTVKSGIDASPGAVTVYYTGTGVTNYSQSSLPPVSAGTYAVTFSVAPASGWNAANLSAGILTITAHYASDNLVVNGGFEDGLDGWLGTAKTYITVNTAAENVYEGDKSLKVAVPNWTESLYQTIPVTTDKYYKLIFVGKVISGGDSDCIVKLTNNGEYNANASLNTEVQLAEIKLSGNSWKEYTATLNAIDLTATRIVVAGNNSEFYLDKVEFYEIDADSDPNLIKNGSFEQSFDFWALVNSGAGDAFTIVSGAGNVHDGTRAVRYNQTNPDTQWWYHLSQQVSVQTNAAYTLTLWARVVSAATSDDACIEVKSDNADNPVNITKVNPAGSDWKLYTLNFNTGSADVICIKISGGISNYMVDQFGLSKD